MKKLTKTLALFLAILLAIILCSCGAKNNNDLSISAGTTFSEMPENENKDKTSDSEPFAEPLTDAVEVENPPAYEPKAVNIEDIPFETATIDSEISYDTELIEAGFDVEFPPESNEYTYYLSIYNLGDEEISVPPTVDVHAYIGNGEWVKILFGEDDTLELFTIGSGSNVTIRYFPHELPEGTYRGVMSYTTESGEEGYFSFDYVTKQ